VEKEEEKCKGDHRVACDMAQYRSQRQDGGSGFWQSEASVNVEWMTLQTEPTKKGTQAAEERVQAAILG
jgi:hypothetical protein